MNPVSTASVPLLPPPSFIRRSMTLDDAGRRQHLGDKSGRPRDQGPADPPTPENCHLCISPTGLQAAVSCSSCNVIWWPEIISQSNHLMMAVLRLLAVTVCVTTVEASSTTLWRQQVTSRDRIILQLSRCPPLPSTPTPCSSRSSVQAASYQAMPPSCSWRPRDMRRIPCSDSCWRRTARTSTPPSPLPLRSLRPTPR